MPSKEIAVQIQNLNKKYGKLHALKDVNFQISKGDFFGFIGPNGAGKTSTINSIMGLLNFSGSITILGFDVVKNYKESRKIIGLSPQEQNFDNFITVGQTLYYTAGFFGITGKEAEKEVNYLLKLFKLENKRNNIPKTLSGGMKRRLLIARALVHKPEILILDEPTAGLDVKLRRELWNILTKINKKGTTIILTTHYIEEVEKLCNTVGVIHNGKIIALGDKSKIMEDLANQTLVLKTNKPLKSKSSIPLLENGFTITREKNITKITGKGIKKEAKNIIKTVEKSGVEIKEIDLTTESLETIFLRITRD